MSALTLELRTHVMYMDWTEDLNASQRAQDSERMIELVKFLNLEDWDKSSSFLLYPFVNDFEKLRAQTCEEEKVYDIYSLDSSFHNSAVLKKMRVLAYQLAPRVNADMAYWELKSKFFVLKNDFFYRICKKIKDKLQSSPRENAIALLIQVSERLIDLDFLNLEDWDKSSSFLSYPLGKDYAKLRAQICEEKRVYDIFTVDSRVDNSAVLRKMRVLAYQLAPRFKADFAYWELKSQLRLVKNDYFYEIYTKLEDDKVQYRTRAEKTAFLLEVSERLINLTDFLNLEDWNKSFPFPLNRAPNDFKRLRALICEWEKVYAIYSLDSSFYNSVVLRKLQVLANQLTSRDNAVIAYKELKSQWCFEKNEFFYAVYLKIEAMVYSSTSVDETTFLMRLIFNIRRLYEVYLCQCNISLSMNFSR